ncbi:RNA recognition motif-containing [Cordyceps militaris]|uniref:RNA recognition motif-containing n=1 Tax=Cordyceps militaris TaxID=73501 RepID=A0A2H4S5J8_CORMI|nr:RNA recognition motif-containing [Cordyceps militaris]
MHLSAQVDANAGRLLRHSCTYKWIAGLETEAGWFSSSGNTNDFTTRLVAIAKMAAREGEEIVATLFADIHYFYGGEEVKPRHHRFDKGSYVYLFENAHERRCRIEIANNAGTEDQDAFDGFLDQAHVRYSYNQHSVVSLTVAPNVPQDEWHLPTYDPRNENKYHYQLHALDIYFWTDKDALQFVNGVRRVLPPAQVEVLDEPVAVAVQPGGAVSAVVQNLENVAISDPQYSELQDPAASAQQNGAVVPSSASTALSMDNLPPPPPMPPHMQQQQQQQPKAATSYAPMAYNPAAPVAPEAVTYREKTPPPDEDPLNPLAVAVAYDYQGQPFTPAYPHAQFPPGVASPGFAPSGMASPRMAPPSFGGGPPQQLGIHRAQTMPVHAGLASPGLNSVFGANLPGPPSFAAPPTVASPPQAAQPPPPPQSSPPAATTAASPPPPLGGYSNYSYSNPTPAQNGGLDYSLHQQVYRPTEVEMSAKLQPYQPKKETKSKLEQKAGKLENGVTGMLKRFEKKFG